MPDETPTAPETRPAFTIRPDGKLVFADVIVGKYETDGETLTLNLGWAREAGLHVKCLSDPAVDRKRSGLVIDR